MSGVAAFGGLFYAARPMKLRSTLLTATLAVISPASVFAESALERGQKFLKENGAKEGIKTTASGLQYKITKEGEGRSPKATDTVVVHYRGTLISGKEFDSSYKRNEPAEFPLNAVIKGWTEGLLYLREGGKAMLYIPSELAYGKNGAGTDIGPDETLIFEVELIRIK
jgi:FKBP-type peptidyl-prolyl cis-trans isomerase